MRGGRSCATHASAAEAEQRHDPLSEISVKTACQANIVKQRDKIVKGAAGLAATKCRASYYRSRQDGIAKPCHPGQLLPSVLENQTQTRLQRHLQCLHGGHEMVRRHLVRNPGRVTWISISPCLVLCAYSFHCAWFCLKHKTIHHRLFSLCLHGRIARALAENRPHSKAAPNFTKCTNRSHSLEVQAPYAAVIDQDA